MAAPVFRQHGFRGATIKALAHACGLVVSVLPLPILPFVPEQSVTHYGAHVVYTVGQIPLVVLGYRALRASAAAETSGAAEAGIQ